MNAQFKKGVLEMCVLAVIAGKDAYGFELASRVSHSIAMSEGTVYPLLKRLKDDGFVNAYLLESTEGPPRKYYQLTDEGRRRLSEQRDEWRQFTKGVDELLEGAMKP